MKKALVIINGIQFPYFLAEQSIAQSKQAGEGLHALFLVSGKEMPEGYAFPSDIDLAATLNDKEDSENDSLMIVRSQMKLFRNMAETAGVDCITGLKVDPTLDEIKEQASGSSRLFIAPNYGDVALQAIMDPTMQEVIGAAPCPVVVVDEPSNKESFPGY